MAKIKKVAPKVKSKVALKPKVAMPMSPAEPMMPMSGGMAEFFKKKSPRKGKAKKC